MRLGAGAVHDGRGSLEGGAGGLRPPLGRWTHISRLLHHQLVPSLSNGPKRPGGGLPRDRGPPLLHPVPLGRRLRPPYYRHDPARDHAWRHGRGRPPRGRPLPSSRWPDRHPPVGGPPPSTDSRRARRPGFRHRHPQGDAGPRPVRFRNRAPPRARPSDRNRRKSLHGCA